MSRLAPALLVLLLAAGAPAAAQNRSRADELADVERRLKDRTEEEKRLRDEAEERGKEVAALRYRMIETANSLQAAERRIGEIGEELERLGEQESALAASLKTQQANLGDVLAALQSLELSKPPALLVSPDDANKAARAAMLLAEAAPALGERAAVLKADLDRLVEIRDRRDRERVAFRKTSVEIAERRTLLAELLEKKQDELDVATRLARAAQSETAALAARATDLKELIRRLERLARAITPRIKPPAPRPDRPTADIAPQPKPTRAAERFAPSRPFSDARGALKPPVAGRLIGLFGGKRPEGGVYDGVRFSASDQAIVTSPYEANVVFARNWGPIGNLIVLDVGGGYHILLMGVSQFLVEQGQKVAAGEPLGLVAGASGGQEARLDLEIRKDGEPVNPSLWLSRKSIEEMAY
ncbi:MAG: murein hydrolase activator EnvC [Amphiplicatus sp.]